MAQWMLRLVSLSFVTLLASGMSSLLVSSVAAQDHAPTAVLEWSSSAECADVAALEQAIVAVLGRDPFRDGPPVTFRIEGRLAPGEQGLSAVIRMFDAAGVVLGIRTVRGSRCDELLQALAIVIAMMIESPELESTLVAVPTRRERASDLGVVAGVSTVALAGASAPFLIGGGLLLGVRSRALDLEARVRLEVLGTPFLWPGVSVSVVGFRAEGGLCLDIGADVGRVGACASLAGSWASARGYDFDVTHSAELVGLDVGANVRGALFVGGTVRLRAELGLLVPLVRSPLEVLGADGVRTVLWDSWPVVPVLRIEAVVELPSLLGTTLTRAHSSL